MSRRKIVPEGWTKEKGITWKDLCPGDMMILLNSVGPGFADEEMQLTAVNKSPRMIELFPEPSEKVRRLHELKWKL